MRSPLTALLSFVFATLAWAAGPQVEWLRLAGGNSRDLGLAACADPQGNVIVAGAIQGTATFGQTNVPADGNAFIAKYSPGGTVLWVRVVSPGYEAQTVAADGQGKIFVAGHYQATVIDTNGGVHYFPYRLFVSKYDPAGTQLWTTARTNQSPDLSEAGSVHPYASAVDAAGNFFVAGEFYGSFFTGSTNVQDSGNGWTDCFVAKFSPSGNTSWVLQGGGNNFDNVGGLALGRNGRVIIGGSCGNGFVLGSYSLPQTNFIAEIETNGTVVALQTFDYWPRGGLAGNGSGEFYVWGTTRDPYQATLTKFASVSTVLWRTTLTNTWYASPSFQGVTLDRYGNVWAGVNYYDSSSNVLMRFNPRGTVDCEIPLGVIARDVKFAPDPKGNLFCVGSSGSQITSFGHLSITNQHWTSQDSEIVVARINTPPPSLAIRHIGTNVTIAWPAWANFMDVETSPLAQGPWQTLTNTPTSTPTQNLLSQPRGPAPRYYRLKLR